MNPLQKWLLAARPKTLWASVAPVVVGTAMAYGDGLHHWPSAVVALCCAVLIQVGTNLANDYFDYTKGADIERKEGPLRLTQAGLISPRAMKIATILVFLIACVGAIALVRRGGIPIVLIGVSCILAGILYTGGPFPYGYHGLGDLLCLIFFGPVAVSGTYYVQALSFHPTVALAGLGPGMLITAILTVNNLRDMEDDRKAGKRTLAVYLGSTFTRWEYALLVILGASTPVLIYLITGQRISSLLTLLVIPLAWPAYTTLRTRSDGAALNPALAYTARLPLVYSLLFTLGWLL
ncbi:MAG: 1,4-dihydroxy-2-naphthoate polyprenyltransferase [Deltaproteobacteria bacterium]|nr:1,4-dihydroxy-2-naphthoate polyprenyltransferase [Deltaproteobacteria bacterium]